MSSLSHIEVLQRLAVLAISLDDLQQISIAHTSPVFAGENDRYFAFSLDIEHGLPQFKDHVVIYPACFKVRYQPPSHDGTVFFRLPGSIFLVHCEGGFEEREGQIGYRSSGRIDVIFSHDEEFLNDIYENGNVPILDNLTGMPDALDVNDILMATDEKGRRLYEFSARNKNAIHHIKDFKVAGELTGIEGDIPKMLNEVVYSAMNSIQVDGSVLHDALDDIMQMPSDQRLHFGPYFMVTGRREDAILIAESSGKTPECLINHYVAAILTGDTYYFDRYPEVNLDDTVIFSPTFLINVKDFEPIPWEYWTALRNEPELYFSGKSPENGSLNTHSTFKVSYREIMLIFLSNPLIERFADDFKASSVRPRLITSLLEYSLRNDAQVERVSETFQRIIDLDLIDPNIDYTDRDSNHHTSTLLSSLLMQKLANKAMAIAGV